MTELTGNEINCAVMKMKRQGRKIKGNVYGRESFREV